MTPLQIARKMHTQELLNVPLYTGGCGAEKRERLQVHARSLLEGWLRRRRGAPLAAPQSDFEVGDQRIKNWGQNGDQMG